MKLLSLFIFTLLVMAPGAFANNSVKLPNGSTRLTLLEPILLEVVTRRCPPASRCSPTSTYGVLGFTLHGCADSISPVTVMRIPSHDRKLRLAVTAYNIHTKRSERIRCLRARQAEIKVELGAGTIRREDIALETPTPRAAYEF